MKKLSPDYAKRWGCGVNGGAEAARGAWGDATQLSGPAIWLPLSSQAIRFLMGPSRWFLYVSGEGQPGLITSLSSSMAPAL